MVAVMTVLQQHKDHLARAVQLHKLVKKQSTAVAQMECRQLRDLRIRIAPINIVLKLYLAVVKMAFHPLKATILKDAKSHAIKPSKLKNLKYV